MTRENVDRLETHCVFLYSQILSTKYDARRKPKKLERSRVHYMRCKNMPAHGHAVWNGKVFCNSIFKLITFHFPLK